MIGYHELYEFADRLRRQWSSAAVVKAADILDELGAKLQQQAIREREGQAARAAFRPRATTAPRSGKPSAKTLF